MKRAVLFDVNHTLMGIRNEQAIQSVAVDVLFGTVSQMLGRVISRTEFRDTFERAWTDGKRASFEKYEETNYEDIVRWILAQYKIQVDDISLERVLQTYMHPLYDNVYTIAGMTPILNELRGRVKIGVITNYKYGAGMREMLSRAGLTPFLDSIVISSEIGWKKPDERIYQRALSDLSLQASEVVIIGNELEKDLWRAHEMGMTPILYEPLEHADHDAEFAELLRQRLDLSNVNLAGVATTPESLAEILAPLLEPSTR